MAPEILSFSPLVDKKGVIEVLSDTFTSMEAGKDSSLHASLAPLFQENTLAKLLSVAQTYIENDGPPSRFPETVPQSGPNRGQYLCRDAEFWTCGFFPGSLYCLLERLRKSPGSSLSNVSPASPVPPRFLQQTVACLTDLCRKWSAPLHAMSARKDTHDLGFIVQPALRRDWELFGHQESLDSLLAAAESLASRFDERVGAIRSWDSFSNAHHNITSMDDDFLVIIDSLCNLDLLFYAGHYTRSPRLLSIASTHATKVLSTHLRRESMSGKGRVGYSTYHAVNLSPPNHGAVKRKLTAQGYSDDSTWARGQAWAILGYAQTYSWTKEPKFLEAAMGLADYFIFRLEEKKEGCYVPLWDFDAPITYTAKDDGQAPLRDVSAGLVAANGMMILHGQLLGGGEHEAARRYFDYASAIVKDTIRLAYNRDEMRLVFEEETGGKVKVKAELCKGGHGRRFDALLEQSTANFNKDHADRHWDHGLVYADYYFLEFGNRLLELGLV